MAERSITAGYMKDALKYLKIAHESDPLDFAVMLQLGAAYNMLAAWRMCTGPACASSGKKPSTSRVSKFPKRPAFLRSSAGRARRSSPVSRAAAVPSYG